MAIVTRPGNPKNIRGWDDLIRSLPTHSVSTLRTAKRERARLGLTAAAWLLSL